MSKPIASVIHSLLELGFRKIRTRGVVQTDSVHVEYSVDAQFGFFSSNAGDMAVVANVGACLQTPVPLAPDIQKYSFDCIKNFKLDTS